MTDLRKAAEMALTKLDHLWEIGIDAEYKVELLPEIHALRQALAQPEQKREWVGLTRKEAEDVVDDFITIGGDVENWVGYWQAIEAKLKEKNT